MTHTPASFVNPPPGWNIVSTDPTTSDPELAAITCVANVPFASKDLTYPLPDGRMAGPAWPTQTITSLPPEGVVVVISLPIPERSPGPQDYVNFPPRPVPLQLSDARQDTSWEGQPGPNIAQWILWSTINERFVDVRVYFGSPTPSRRLVGAAQELLNRLLIPPPVSSGAPR